MKYSLTKRILTIKIPESVASKFGVNAISIGGSGSYLDSISLSFNSDLWSVKGDVTGGHIFDRNDDETGTCTVTLSQLSDRVRQLITLTNIYKQSKDIEDGLTIELRESNGDVIATCNDCMPQRIPNQDFAAQSGNQSWTFLCGQIVIH